MCDNVILTINNVNLSECSVVTDSLDCLTSLLENNAVINVTYRNLYWTQFAPMLLRITKIELLKFLWPRKCDSTILANIHKEKYI